MAELKNMNLSCEMGTKRWMEQGMSNGREIGWWVWEKEKGCVRWLGIIERCWSTFRYSWAYDIAPRCLINYQDDIDFLLLKLTINLIIMSVCERKRYMYQIYEIFSCRSFKILHVLTDNDMFLLHFHLLLFLSNFLSWQSRRALSFWECY